MENEKRHYKRTCWYCMSWKKIMGTMGKCECQGWKCYMNYSCDRFELKPLEAEKCN